MIVPCYFCEGLLNTDALGFCPHCGGSMQRAIERTRERYWENKESSYFVNGGIYFEESQLFKAYKSWGQ